MERVECKQQCERKETIVDGDRGKINFFCLSQ